MHAFVVIIGIGWIVFWIGWLVASASAKSSQGRWGGFSAVRAVLIVVAVYLVQLSLGGWGHRAAVAAPLPGGIGLAVWAAGLGLAVWARLYIGRNWGTPMSRRVDPDLVTSGPYRFIRHPIYTGIIVGVVGTALATSLFGLIAAAVLAVFFCYSAVSEERFLAKQFPDTFPAYKARTKMLIPFVV